MKRLLSTVETEIGFPAAIRFHLMDKMMEGMIYFGDMIQMLLRMVLRGYLGLDYMVDRTRVRIRLSMLN